MDNTNPDWHLIAQQLHETVEGCHWLSALANASALLYELIPNVNWVGFYLAADTLGVEAQGEELLLGPFQGKVACVSIPSGRGVCGTAALADKTLRVDDVLNFDGHIACDAESRSEVVIPLHSNGRVIGVLDIDSPLLARFDERDQAGLEACARCLEACFVKD